MEKSKTDLEVSNLPLNKKENFHQESPDKVTRVCQGKFWHREGLSKPRNYIFSRVQREKAVRELLTWYGKHGRNFIWREEGFPGYSLLVAEMMLQKTQAKVVEPVLKEFLARYPTVESVHKARRKEIEKLIKRLGLFRGRSKNIKRVAKIIVKKHGGNVEAAMDKLAELPGVGPYVSSAVACFKEGKRVPAVDANVARVIGRLYGIDHKDPKRQKELLEKARKLLPRNNVKEFNWAMIDLGALVCKPSNPKHEECPLRPICHAEGGG